MRKVVVTGGAGFVGFHVVAELAQRGNDVIVVDTMEHGAFRHLGDFKGDFVVADVADAQFSRRLADLNPDAVIHLAGITDTLHRHARELMHQNVEGFRNVLAGARLSDANLVYASSAAVYGNGDIPMKETARRQPHNLYGFSKLLLENLASRHYEDTGLPTVGLRYFNVYGPGEGHKGRAASMVHQAVACAGERRAYRLFRDGEQARDFVHVRDVARATVAAITCECSGVLNVGTGVQTSFNTLVKIVAEATGQKLVVEWVETLPWEYQAVTQASIDRASHMIDYVPEVFLRDGIRSLVSRK